MTEGNNLQVIYTLASWSHLVLFGAPETAVTVAETVVPGTLEVVLIGVGIIPIACRIQSESCVAFACRSFCIVLFLLLAAFLAICRQRKAYIMFLRVGVDTLCCMARTGQFRSLIELMLSLGHATGKKLVIANTNQHSILVPHCSSFLTKATSVLVTCQIFIHTCITQTHRQRVEI